MGINFQIKNINYFNKKKKINVFIFNINIINEAIKVRLFNQNPIDYNTYKNKIKANVGGSLIGKIVNCDFKECEFKSRPSPNAVISSLTVLILFSDIQKKSKKKKKTLNMINKLKKNFFIKNDIFLQRVFGAVYILSFYFQRIRLIAFKLFKTMINKNLC